MEAFYSSPAHFESYNEGERSCPDFDKLIQSAESANAELVRFLEEETQKTLALQKELDAQNKKREEHERSSNRLNEEAKELHKRFLQNKDTSENLKKTSILLSQHEEELQKKYEMTCSSLEQLRLQNSGIVERYQNTWKRYYAIYESSEMAGKLSGIKGTALELQKEVNDTVERISEMKLQVNEVGKEKKEMEDILHLGGTSPKRAIISLAEIYIEMSNKAKLAKENFLKQQQKEREKELEKENNSLRRIDEQQQNVQAMECETEHLEGCEGSHQTENVPVMITAERVTPESSDTFHPNNVALSNTEPSQVSQHLPRPSSMKTVTTSQLNKPISKGPAITNGLTTSNTRGLLGYPRLNMTTPISMPPSPLISQTPTPNRHQLVDSLPVTCASQRNLPSAFENTSRGEAVSQCQDQVTSTSLSVQNTGPATDCQTQMTVEHTASTTSTKSPGPHISYSSPNTPKTPTSVGQHSDIFNFGDYRETIKQMSKSPGEGFSYQSRPMFETIQGEEGSRDIPTGDTQTSFFQPFFQPRQQEIGDQFAATPTFFNMSSNKDQEEMDKQGNQFQPHSNTSSTSVCGSIFSMSPGPRKESEESTSTGFALFGDQPASEPGNHGKQLSTSKSPDFTFNFGASSYITEERATSQGATFNLF